MNSTLALWLCLGASMLALIYGLVSVSWILGRSAGTERMQEIAAAIQEGASAYMNRQYQTIAIVGVVLFIVLGFALEWPTAIGFGIGAVFSALAGYIGMFV
ncbi:MAG: sodium/proton-translocating pyrophosphatase, partial [Gammaproteobacteria bacterium]